MTRPIKFMMLLGFAFLYLPLILIIILSFNDSNLMTVWGGFSAKWYHILWEDKEIIATISNSLKIASAAATISTILGTLAGIILARYRSSYGNFFFSGMISAPFVMPEVITGFSLLLLFVNVEQFLGWTIGRGITTIIFAHVTLGMTYVSVLVQLKISSLDRHLEEAAMDLGARPHKIFWVITLPLISPTLIAGWLLAFTLSLDDLILASFTSGPSSSTLPMLIYSRIRLGVSPEVNALATVTITLVSILVSCAMPIILRGKKKL